MVRFSAELQPLECVAFILVEDGRVLVERRHLWKPVDPGALAIPGGHLEAVGWADRAVLPSPDCLAAMRRADAESGLSSELRQLMVRPCHSDPDVIEPAATGS